MKWIERSLIVGPYVTLVLDEQQFHKAMKHCQIHKKDRGSWIKTEHSDATVHFLETPAKEQCCIVAVRVKKDTDPNSVVGILVHEAVHIWQKFSQRIGEHEPSEEFEAYAIQSISQRLIAAYSEQKAEWHKAKGKKK